MIWILIAAAILLSLAGWGVRLYRRFLRTTDRKPRLRRIIGNLPDGTKRVVLKEEWVAPPRFWPWVRNDLNRVHALGRDTYLRFWPNPGAGVTIRNHLYALGVASGFRVFKRNDAASPWRLMRGR